MDSRELQKYRSLRDGEVVQAALQGDQAVVAALLVDRCGSALRHLVRHRYPMLRLEFGDIVGEVFLALRENDWKALRDFRGENAGGNRCGLVTYVTVIASHLLWKKLARAVKGIDWNAPQIDQDGIQPVGIVRDRALSAVEVMDAIMALESDSDRELLLRYKLQGRSAEEVAEEMGLTTACVYTRCSRALERLRAMLAEDGGHE